MHTIHNVIHAVRRQAIVVLSIAALSVMVASPSAAQSRVKPSTEATSARLNIRWIQPFSADIGDNRFEVTVKGADGTPVTDADVSVLFIMPAWPIKRIPETRSEVNLTSAGGGTYTGIGQVAMAGTWVVTVSVKHGGKTIGHKNLWLNAL